MSGAAVHRVGGGSGMDREISASERRRRVVRRGLWSVATVVAAGSILLFAADWLRPSLRRSAIRTGTVTRGDLEATLMASGTVVPAAERVIASPIAGRVERVLLRPGDAVQPGDEILELDLSATRLELERLEEKLAQNGNDRLQRTLELEEKLADLQGRVETQTLDLEMARFRLEQNRTLKDEGLISEDAWKEAGLAVDKAEISLRQIREQMETERRLNAARLEGLALDAGILEKEREDARRQMRLATTAAPVAGVLSMVFQQEGAEVPQGEVLARIADLNAFRVEARISDAYASRLAAGQEAWIVTDGRKLPARVDAILPSVEEGTVRFDVALDDPTDDVLRQNLRVDVLVVTGRRDGTLLAPRGPYIAGGGVDHQVFVVDPDRPDRAVRTDVTVGLMGHEHLEITSGLQEGDAIIISDTRDVIHAKEIRLR